MSLGISVLPIQYPMLCLECQEWWQAASAWAVPLLGTQDSIHFERRLHSSFSRSRERSLANACRLCTLILSSIEHSCEDLLTTSDPAPGTGTKPQPDDEVHLELYLYYYAPHEHLDPLSSQGSISSRLKCARHHNPLSESSCFPSKGPYNWQQVGKLIFGLSGVLRECLEEISDVPDEFTGSDCTFRLISAWIQHCVTNHECPKPLKETALPARVLDVGPSDASEEPRLVETSGARGRYLALSHCWGDPATSGIVTTTHETYSARLASIPITSLPKTFQDAVYITRKLGIRWLWIDSLCIIQGSPEDWAIQAAQMCSIYRNAYLTIAASSASNSSVGCFSPRDGHNIRPLELPFLIPSLKPNNPSKPVFLSPIGSRERDTAKPLESRCWTLQERILSSRIVSFEDGMVAFSCNSIECNEADPSGRDYREYGHDYKKLQRSFLHHTASHKAPIDRITTRDEQFHHASWSGVVENYTSRQLTYNKDKLAAIHGIADAVLQRKKRLTYLAGLWKSWLLYDLLWNADWEPIGVAHGRPTPPVAPSWSWASVNGPIKTLWSENELRDFRPQPLARLLTAEVEGPMSTQTGRVVVEGYLKSAIVVNNDPSDGKPSDDELFQLEEGEYRLFDGSSNVPLDAAVSPDESLASNTKFTFLALVQMYPLVIPFIVGPALVPDGPDGQFKRVGLCRWAGYAWLGKERPGNFALGLKFVMSKGLDVFGKERRERRVAKAGWGDDVPIISEAKSRASGLQRGVVTIV